ncbi:MAG: RDD family protein, partial [Acidimicrobiales bacterium]
EVPMSEPYTNPPATGASGPRASFGIRFLAFLIDSIIVGAVSGLLFVALKAVGYALGLVIGLGYYSYFEGSPSGQTIGKRVMNIRVFDYAGGGPLGIGRALLRSVGRYVSGLVCLLGYLWMLWDQEKQTWHDKIANTVVVPTESYPVAAWPG